MFSPDLYDPRQLVQESVVLIAEKVAARDFGFLSRLTKFLAGEEMHLEPTDYTLQQLSRSLRFQLSDFLRDRSTAYPALMPKTLELLARLVSYPEAHSVDAASGILDFSESVCKQLEATAQSLGLPSDAACPPPGWQPPSLNIGPLKEPPSYTGSSFSMPPSQMPKPGIPLDWAAFTQSVVRPILDQAPPRHERLGTHLRENDILTPAWQGAFSPSQTFIDQPNHQHHNGSSESLRRPLPPSSQPVAAQSSRASAVSAPAARRPRKQTEPRKPAVSLSHQLGGTTKHITDAASEGEALSESSTKSLRKGFNVVRLALHNSDAPAILKRDGRKIATAEQIKVIFEAFSRNQHPSQEEDNDTLQRLGSVPDYSPWDRKRLYKWRTNHRNDLIDCARELSGLIPPLQPVPPSASPNVIPIDGSPPDAASSSGAPTLAPPPAPAPDISTSVSAQTPVQLPERVASETVLLHSNSSVRPMQLLQAKDRSDSFIMSSSSSVEPYTSQESSSITLLSSQLPVSEEEEEQEEGEEEEEEMDEEEEEEDHEIS